MGLDRDHEKLHSDTERAITRILDKAFDDNLGCRAVTLVSLLHDVFLELEDAEDVADIIAAMSHMVIVRATDDSALLYPAGSA